MAHMVSLFKVNKFFAYLSILLVAAFISIAFVVFDTEKNKQDELILPMFAFAAQ